MLKFFNFHNSPTLGPHPQRLCVNTALDGRYTDGTIGISIAFPQSSMEELIRTYKFLYNLKTHDFMTGYLLLTFPLENQNVLSSHHRHI